MIKHFTKIQLVALQRMRERFLTGTAGGRDYWRMPEDVALYDGTFGERIGWKWDAVLRELARRGWRPESRQAIDWGCGSGVAGRRALAAWPQLATLTLHDRSASALRFAAERARAELPHAAVRTGELPAAEALLLVSHVINELTEPALEELLMVARRAREVIWVEAGTHADSRRLIAVRERLLATGQFHVVAPCTHQASCGMLAAKNAPHWCHHFADPPSSAFQDARWAEFGRELNIDLRSLPYSFLVLTRDPVSMPPDYSRVIGEARESKGYLRVLSCHEKGVTDFMLQKRDASGLFRTLRKSPEAPLYRWTLEPGKIVAGEPWPACE